MIITNVEQYSCLESPSPIRSVRRKIINTRITATTADAATAATTVNAVLVVVVLERHLQLQRAVRAVLPREAAARARVVVADALVRAVHLAEVAVLPGDVPAPLLGAVRLVQDRARVVRGRAVPYASTAQAGG